MPSYLELKATADRLGIPLEKLLGNMSYETGGTLDPQQLGPTTQWGQHQGLIQYGKPQAAAAGVDFSTPESAWATQLGADGGIVNYALDAGFEPGVHDWRQFYSTVNAGGPNRFNASDANNGGAPGTVADKIVNQIPAHIARFTGADAAANALVETGIVMNPDGSISRARSMPAFTPEMNPDGSIGPAAEDMDVDTFLKRFDGNLGSGAGRGTLSPAGISTNSGGTLLPMFEAPELSGWDKTRTTMMDVADVYFNGIRGRAPVSQGRGAAVRDEIMSKKTRNATAEWLAGQGRQDLADAVLSGAMTGTQAAAQMYNREAGANRYKAVGDKIFDTTTGEFVDATGGEGVDVNGRPVDKDTMTWANTLRDDYTKAAGVHTDVLNNYGNIEDAIRNPGSVSDLQLAVSFAKVLDPGSVAREGEVSVIQKAGGLLPQLKQALSNAISSEGNLTPAQREEIYRLARTKAENSINDVTSNYNRYKRIAEQQGIPLHYVLPDAAPTLNPAVEDFSRSPTPEAEPPVDEEARALVDSAAGQAFAGTLSEDDRTEALRRYKTGGYGALLEYMRGLGYNG